MPFEENKKELELLQNERVYKVVLAARDEFIEQGIMNAKIKNIALRAAVSEATIYRYFQDKNELAKLVAFHFWNEMYHVFSEIITKEAEQTKNPIDLIRSFLYLFIRMYKDYPKFLIFTEDFDGYMQYVINDNKTASFQVMISDIKEYFMNLIKKGINTGEIRDDIDVVYIYSFVSQVMSSTAQKLVSRVGYLHEDVDGYGERCLSELIEMFIHYIKKEKKD